jgi:hypothetical protein
MHKYDVSGSRQRILLAVADPRVVHQSLQTVHVLRSGSWVRPANDGPRADSKFVEPGFGERPNRTICLGDVF